MNRKNILISFLYIIGTLGGLYFYKNIIFFFCIVAILVMVFLKKNNHRSIVIFIIMLGFIRAGCTNNYINYLYKNNNENYIEGCVSKITDTTSSQKLTVSLKKMNGKRALVSTKLYVYVKKGTKKIAVGDTIAFKERFSGLDYAKNTGNFNYKKHLQSKKIFGVIKTDSVEIINHGGQSLFAKAIESIRSMIRAQFNRYLPEKNAHLCCALILGEKDNIDDEIIKSFSDSGISHIIAISGMHTAYVASTIIFLTKKLGKRYSYFFTIIALVIFCNIANNSESVLRATIMIILYYISKLTYRNSDSTSNLSIAILINIILNPYSIYSIGLIMSSAGTLGILKFYNKQAEDNNNGKYKKIISYIKNQIKIGFCANLALVPIIALYYNKFSLMFIINSPIINFLVSIIMPVLILFTACGLTHNFIPVFIQKTIGDVVFFLSNCLISMANFFQKMDILNFTVITPSFVTIVVYYTVLFLINSININKKGIKKLIKIILVLYLCICIVTKIASIYDNTLRIHFVDVGQGDCTYIKTPSGKNILIDGGGNESGKDHVGEQILIPFLLNKSITKIDYIIISHFDTDHVGGIITVMENLKVNNIVISKQNQNSENYKRFIELVKQKKIKVIVVKKGDRLVIENNLFFDILWPNSEHIINENILNNNSIVCNLHYKDFSMLFTGDIEKIAEEQIVQEYKEDYTKLHATVLKVGHHGSKTSSTQQFIEKANPKYALIGVGVNNKFGHPNSDIIGRLKTNGAKIYRTDEDGEITISVKSGVKIKFKKFVNE